MSSRSYANDISRTARSKAPSRQSCLLGWSSHYCECLVAGNADDLSHYLQTYISGNALVILGGAQELLQTIYEIDTLRFEAVTIEQSSGQIAACGGSQVFVYKPHGREDGALRVQASEQTPS